MKLMKVPIIMKMVDLLIRRLQNTSGYGTGASNSVLYILRFRDQKDLCMTTSHSG
jgi:hypothetical protein